MPGRRAAALRAALADALGGPVDLFPTQLGERISAPAPPADDWERWRRATAVLRTADAWGSSDTGDATQIWAEVRQES